MAHIQFKNPNEYIERAIATIAFVIDAERSVNPNAGGMDIDIANGKAWALDNAYSDLKQASALLSSKKTA